MKKVKQLTVLVEDPFKPGLLGEVASALGAKKVNIGGFMTAEVEGRGGAVRLIVDRPAVARKILEQRGWEVTQEEVIELTFSDKPGALGAMASKLGAAGVNIQYAYTGSAQNANKVNTYCAVANMEAALKALR